MRVAPTVFSAPEDLGRSLARLIADRLVTATPGTPFLLGCPSGRSPASTYRALVDEVRRRDIDLRDLVIVMMDEYVETDARPVDPRAEYSCARFGREEIVAPLSAAASAGRGIADNHFWVPDPATPSATTGHREARRHRPLHPRQRRVRRPHRVQPAIHRTARPHARRRARRVQTRRDNLGTFPTFGQDLDRVPRRGVTVGVGHDRRPVQGGCHGGARRPQDDRRAPVVCRRAIRAGLAGHDPDRVRTSQAVRRRFRVSTDSVHHDKTSPAGATTT